MNSKELAKLAGVSQSTVSLSLNDSPFVAQKTKERIKKLAKEHNFELNSYAKSLRTKKFGVVGIIMPERIFDMDFNYYYYHLYNKIRKELAKGSIDPLILYDYSSDNKKSHIQQVIRKKPVDGLMILRGDLDKSVIDFLKKSNIPTVNVLNGENFPDVEYSVHLDNYGSGYQVGEYFARSGHKNVATIGVRKGECEISGSIERTKGFQDGLIANGVELPHENIFYGDFTFNSGCRIVNENKNEFKNITALFAQNDLMALGAMRTLKRAGFRVPEDIEVVGHDDIPDAVWADTELTTMAIPSDALSEKASSMMLKLLDGKELKTKAYILKTSLIVRGSSKK